MPALAAAEAAHGDTGEEVPARRGEPADRRHVRIIAATNKSLEEEVAAGRFRKDLFFRFSVFPIRVPPLRERSEDIPILADFFLRRFARKCGKEVGPLSADDVSALCAYDWPGTCGTGEFHRARRHPGGGGPRRDRGDAGGSAADPAEDGERLLPPGPPVPQCEGARGIRVRKAVHRDTLRRAEGS